MYLFITIIFIYFAFKVDFPLFHYIYQPNELTKPIIHIPQTQIPLVHNNDFF